MICPNCNKHELNRMGELYVCKDCPCLALDDQGNFRPATQAEIDQATQDKPIGQDQTQTPPEAAQPEQIPTSVQKVEAKASDSDKPDEATPDSDVVEPGPEPLKTSGLDDTIEIDVQFT